jgi:glycerol-3-phosphate dehydrogenase
MPMDRARVVIVGGGVVGCAIAQAMATRWDDVFLLEAMPHPGMGASSRNSGVLHSGIYYPPGSLKQRLCVRGNALTHEFCAAHRVPHRRCGKIVVASSSSEIPALEGLLEQGRANGVEGLRLIDRAAIRAREPHVEGVAALEVPSTGIVASEDLTRAYSWLAQQRGAHLLTDARVTHLEVSASGMRVTCPAGEIQTDCLINSAGLHADEVAAMLGSPLARHRIYPVRGEYAEVTRPKRELVRGLVYPLPDSDGLSLGVHLTKTVWDTLLLGPTAEYIDARDNYEGNRLPLSEFARRARALLPEITEQDLLPAYSGIRAKLLPPGEKGFSDFVIERDPRAPSVVHLIGMDSPGLTSASAIAEYVLALAEEILT